MPAKAKNSSWKAERMMPVIPSQPVENAKIMGAKEVFISAKNYNFFKELGFIEGEPKNLDLNNDCKGCPQFLNGCNPVKMKIDI